LVIYTLEKRVKRENREIIEKVKKKVVVKRPRIEKEEKPTANQLRNCSYEMEKCKNEGKHCDLMYPEMFYCDKHVLITDSLVNQEIIELDKEINENCNISKDDLKILYLKRYKLSSKMCCGIPQYQVQHFKKFYM
jgi:hypothetical protein